MRTFRILFFILLLPYQLPATPAGDADSLVNLAWLTWTGKHTDMAEQLFRDALKADPGNTRASLGLALIASYQDKPVESWKSFRNILKTEKDPTPYLFASWLDPRFSINLNDERREIPDILERLTKDPGVDETIRAQACEILGNNYRDRGDLAASDRWYAAMHAILQWTLSGPFENVSASGFDKVFPPELAYDTTKPYPGKNDIPTRWFPVTAVRADCWIDHQCYFAYDHAIYYANTFVYAPERMPVQVRIGTSGSLKAFLNDELLIAYFDENNNDLDTYIVATELQKGWNRLLIKCGHSEISKCNFMVRITRPEGGPISTLTVSTAPQQYVKSPGAPKKIIGSFAEEFFRERIRLQPDHFENYVLLADAYSRNDKAIEAELTLREALRRLPDCPLFTLHINEAYTRGEKYDEANQSLDKLLSLDPENPSALIHKLNRELENENFDEAQATLARLEAVHPGTEALYTGRLAYYAKRKQVDKIIEVTEEGLRALPDNWNFVYLKSLIEYQKTQKYQPAMDVLESFIKRHRSQIAQVRLAEYALKSSDLAKWEETYARMFVQDPCSPGWYNTMADVYTEAQMLDKAEHALLSALTICPNASVYWSKLGNVYRSKKEMQKAEAAYRNALAYNPRDFDVRETVRELEGKRSVFARFSSVDVDSLVKAAPTARDYPNDNAIVLLDDTKRVVFDRGASLSTREALVRMLKPSGIDDYKEFGISFNSNTEKLIVEKAVSIKKDGTQVKADVDGGSVVFKSLEEGDFIYLKWKIKNLYFGKMSNHFWDTQQFNGYHPAKLVRYALLVPSARTFSHKTQNMPDAPLVSSSEDGDLYQWTQTDQPAIRYEQGMPDLEDVGKILYISSIPDWEHIGDWYSDLAQTKSRGSYEIKETVERLFAGKGALTEKEKIRAIYDYITENIRYSNVSFRQSALVPQKARDVLVNRIGDCKDLSTLCIAMLREVGIRADYVLVNTAGDGERRNALPGIVFNHCIAAVETPSGTQYLDLTANNFPASSMPLGDLGAFSLRIASGERLPGYLHPRNFTLAGIRRRSTIEVRGDNSLLVQRHTVRTGASAGGYRMEYRGKGEEDRKRGLNETLGRDFPNVKLQSMSIANLEGPMDTLTDDYTFEAPGYLTETGSFKLFKIPWTDNLTAIEALSYEKRAYQYTLWGLADTMVEEVSIRLPGGYVPVELKPGTTFSSQIAAYRSSLKFTRGVLSGRRELVIRKREVLPEEYVAFKIFYNNVLKEDSFQILLKKK